MSLKDKIPDLKEFGHDMKDVGRRLEEVVNHLGLDKLSKEIEGYFLGDEIDKEQIKKKVKGLIITLKTLPIKKLANAMDITDVEAENVIYELVADGIEGLLETGVFKYSNPSEEVLSKLNDVIDKL